MSTTRRSMLILTSASLAAAAIGGPAAALPAPTQSAPNLEATLAEGFDDLFSHAITRNPNGTWSITSRAQSGYQGISYSDLKKIETYLNQAEREELASQGTPVGFPGRTSDPQGAQEFVTCTLKGLVPGEFFVSLDYGNVYLWIKQHSWGKLSRYIAKHAAKKGIKDLFKFTPAGIAGSVLASMVGCAVWG